MCWSATVDIRQREELNSRLSINLMDMRNLSRVLNLFLLQKMVLMGKQAIFSIVCSLGYLKNSARKHSIRVH